MNLKLTSPNTELEFEYLNFIQEFLDNKEELIPFSLRYKNKNFSALIELINGFSNGKNIPENFVPSTTFWMVNNQNRIIGIIDIRHQLTENLKYFGGHIGYGIRPSERGKGYAVIMLRMALTKAKEIGIKDVLITCKKSNIASAKVIKANGGKLNSEGEIDGKLIQRYLIYL